MGCGQSKEAATAVAANATLIADENKRNEIHGAATSSVSSEDTEVNQQDKETASPKDVESRSRKKEVRVNFQSTPSIVNQRRIDWQVRPGYSSGASSLHDDDFDSDEANLLGTPDSLSVSGDELDGGVSSQHLQKSCSREDSNGSRHSDIVAGLKQNRSASGCDLTEAIVRMETPFDTSIYEIYEGVLDGAILGRGVAGIVRQVKHRATGVHFAVKCLDTGLIDTEEGVQQLRNEISIMCQLDHPNIVRIEEVYESPNEIFIVQELCAGKDLYDRLDEQPDYHYTEAQCAKLVKQMLSSVRYLHSHGIIHRDLKLENFLFSSLNSNSEVRMVDFGLSKHFETGQHHSEIVGTPYTVAPEIIRGDYDETVDIWALGVITYLLLSGETPFGGLDEENLLEVREKIMRAQVSFEPEEIWDRVSEEAKAFVKRLLNPDPKERPTARAVQRDPWIQIWAKKDAREAGKLSPKTVDALIAFKESSEMQKLLSEVLAFTLLPEQIVDLRKEFEKVEDGDGEVSLMTMKRVLMESALGPIKEKEIEEVFDSIKLRKAAPTLRWHEFLAAGLSQARVDDRNLRLAFERLDSQRKGFLTVNDLSVVLGSSIEYEELQLIWLASLKECDVHPTCISFLDFKKLMNGQPKDTVPTEVSGNAPLPVVVEGEHQVTCLPQVMELVAIPELGDSPRISKKHARSRSHGEKSSFWNGDATCGNVAKEARLYMLLPYNIEAKRMMREAVVEASKRFDKKMLDMQSCVPPINNAGLTMRRAKEPLGDLAETVDAHTRSRVNAAPLYTEHTSTRKARRRTFSDVAGMF